LSKLLKDGDLVMTQGAGNIAGLASALAEARSLEGLA